MTRLVVIGAGAIGGTIAVRASAAGIDVVVVARGDHLDAMRASGLALHEPQGATTAYLPINASVADVAWRRDDIAVVAVKSQDTVSVIDQLAHVAPAGLAVACAQNGVHNEPTALRWFERVYGIVVSCPTAHLRPGVVVAYSAPVPGILDIGRYPHGIDATTTELAGIFTAAGFSSHPVEKVERCKWGKLITNLGNAVEAVSGPPSRNGPLGELVMAEGRSVLDAARVDYVGGAEDLERRGAFISLRSVDGKQRPGGSTWQSLLRGVGAETDYLNGEIARVARLHRRRAPANELLQQLVRHLSRSRTGPGSIAATDVMATLSQQESSGKATPATP